VERSERVQGGLRAANQKLITTDSSRGISSHAAPNWGLAHSASSPNAGPQRATAFRAGGLLFLAGAAEIASGYRTFLLPRYLHEGVHE
jgi:hypothetical protein